VYLGRTLDARGKTEPLVAVKRPHRHLATDASFASMLRDEARLAALIDHPNVVKVRELGADGGELFVVFDYVEGASLSDLRKELAAVERAVDTKVAVRIVLDALRGLHAAHELRDQSGKHLGIIHRDVSPHNILLGYDGRVRLTDFGIAKAEDRVQVTRTHEIKGKLAYLAPERVDRRRICTKQSDVFSMAVVLWECLAGRRLFQGDEPVDTLQEVMNAPIPRLRQLGAQVPAALDEAIHRGLSRDLAERYATAAEFAAAIERAAGRSHTGTEADVARVVEAVFGARLALRHQAVRAAVGDDDAERLFAATGIRPRPAPGTPPVSKRHAIAAIAPLAPSGRYAFDVADAQAGRPWGLIAAIVIGGLFGAVAVVSLSKHLAGPRRAAAAEVAVASSVDGPVAATRRVAVPLPLTASHVELDDIKRDLAPPADLAAFDVPRASGVRHRVVAVGVDGSRAEGYVLETDGVARVEEEGFVVVHPTPADPPAHAAPSPGGRAATPSDVARVKNGFTKLR